LASKLLDPNAPSDDELSDSDVDVHRPSHRGEQAFDLLLEALTEAEVDLSARRLLREAIGARTRRVLYLAQRLTSMLGESKRTGARHVRTVLALLSECDSWRSLLVPYRKRTRDEETPTEVRSKATSEETNLASLRVALADRVFEARRSAPDPFARTLTLPEEEELSHLEKLKEAFMLAELAETDMEAHFNLTKELAKLLPDEQRRRRRSEASEALVTRIEAALRPS